MMTQRLQPEMEKCLARATCGIVEARYEGETRCCGDAGRVRLPRECGSRAAVSRSTPRILVSMIESDVSMPIAPRSHGSRRKMPAFFRRTSRSGKAFERLRPDSDRCRVLHIHLQPMQSRMRFGDLVNKRLAPSRNDDVVAAPDGTPRRARAQLPLVPLVMRMVRAQVSMAGLSVSSHHCRKPVGVEFSGILDTAKSRPLSFAQAMSAMPCAMASEKPNCMKRAL